MDDDIELLARKLADLDQQQTAMADVLTLVCLTLQQTAPASADLVARSLRQCLASPNWTCSEPFAALAQGVAAALEGRDDSLVLPSLQKHPLPATREELRRLLRVISGRKPSAPESS